VYLILNNKLIYFYFTDLNTLQKLDKC